MNRINRYVAPLLLSVVIFSANSQAATPDPLFLSSEPLNITLEAPFELIDRERDKDAEYDGTLSYIEADGTAVTLDIGLEVRGNWRLQKDNCRYSQLWVDLKRGQTPNTLFAEQNRLKLVVQCRDRDRYKDYLAKEQQLYEIFARVSDLHFDTRLVNATYVDPNNADDTRTHLAFFIEHQRRLKDRFEMDEVELNNISYHDLDPTQSIVLGLFMFQIANTDYSPIRAAEGDECCHNSKLLVDDAGRYYPIPYDFDSSGFVDANYAAGPSPSVGIRSNRTRQYRGFCYQKTLIDTAVERFMAERESTMAIISDTSHVSERTANRSVRYMEEFYETLEDQRKYQRDILDDCRGELVQ